MFHKALENTLHQRGPVSSRGWCLQCCRCPTQPYHSSMTYPSNLEPLSSIPAYPPYSPTQPYLRLAIVPPTPTSTLTYPPTSTTLPFILTTPPASSTRTFAHLKFWYCIALWSGKVNCKKMLEQRTSIQIKLINTHPRANGNDGNYGTTQCKNNIHIPQWIGK